MKLIAIIDVDDKGLDTTRLRQNFERYVRAFDHQRKISVEFKELLPEEYLCDLGLPSGGYEAESEEKPSEDSTT